MKYINWLPFALIFIVGFTSRDIYENVIRTKHIIIDDPSGNKAYSIETDGSYLFVKNTKTGVKTCISCPPPPNK